MAVLRFRAYWEEDDAVYRDIAIKHVQNFRDLHEIILKAYEFDSKHKATFHRSNDQNSLTRLLFGQKGLHQVSTEQKDWLVTSLQKWKRSTISVLQRKVLEWKVKKMPTA